MKKQQWLSSSALFIFGLVIMIATLRVSHVRASYASNGLVQQTQESETDLILAQLTQSSLPGSVPYLWQRGWERAELLWLAENEKPEIWLGRIADRVESAELADSLGREELALSTYLKAFGYLHQGAHTCFAEGDTPEYCERVTFTAATDALADSVQRFAQSTTSDALRARADSLRSQIQALRQQFQF